MEAAFEKLLQLYCICGRIRYDIRVGLFVGNNHYTMEPRVNRWKDMLGILASVACAVHCAATPLLLAFLPALKLTEWMASPWFHQVAAIVCVSLVSISIWPTFQRFKDYRVLSLSTAGLGLVIAAAFFLPDTCGTHILSTSHSQDGVGHTHDAVSHDVLLGSIVSGPWFASIQPWITPLGGFLLVVAHSMNIRRRFTKCGKQCKCHGDAGANSDVSSINVVRLSNPKAA